MNLFEIYNIKMTSYQYIQLNQWDRYAQEACMAIDQKIKEVAEQFFFNFIQAPKIDIFLELIKRGSDLLLFTLFNYAIKYPHSLIKDSQNFYLIMRQVQKWQLHELNFCRFGARPCANFVTKTIMLALGVFMKYLYENAQTSNNLVKYLEQLPLSYFKMYLFRNFIETVEAIDNEMGFMRFRTMVYNFQDNVIPMICQSLIPFFQKFEEGVKISQLSQLQSKLDVNEHNSGQSTNGEQLSLSKEQDMQSQLVLMLLKKIVEFNYNITYSQYESEQAIDTCLITFPDKVLNKIINHQFLKSLFYVVNKVCETKIGQTKNQYLSIVLECLAKIMQSRLGFVPEKEKQLFIQTSVSGLNHLLRVCQQIQSQLLLIGILNCNKKLFMSVEPSQIRKILNKDQTMRQNQLGQTYVRELSWMIEQIIRRSFVHVDNNLLNEALEVGCKLITGLNYKEFEIMEERNEQSLNFAKQIVRSFVNSLCQPKPIFSCQKIIWISQNKQAVNNLFEQLKKISSYCYKELFTTLRFYLDYKVDFVVLGNILCLLSQLAENSYLSRNINLNQAKQDQIAILAGAIIKTETFCSQYIQNRSAYLNNKDCQYLDITILIFAESIILEFLSNFEAMPSIKIKRKLYLVMSLGEGYSDYVEHEDSNSQITILKYLNLIFPFLESKVEDPDMQIKTLYALQIIQKVIFKLKWHMKREVFLKCQLFKKMLSFFEGYFTECYPSAQILVKVGKITVSLNFDDILDEYKFRINKFIKNLPQDNMSKVFYYLMGIFQAIQPSNIFKYFYNRLKITMDFSLFFAEIFKMAIQTNTQKSYKDVCRFCKILILNKGLKNSNCATLVYQIFNIILPHLVWYMKSINSIQTLDLDLFGECVIELIQLFCGVINSTHVNIFLLDQSSEKKEGQTQSLGVKFVMEYFKLIGNMTNHMKNYPKIQEQVLNCFTSMNKQLLDFIYDNADRQLPEFYNRLILAQIDLSVFYITQQLNGNRAVQDKLIKVIDSLKLFYQYVNRRCEMIHKVDLLANLQGFYNISENCDGQNKNQKLSFYVVSLILTNNKNNISYIRSFSKLIYELNKRFKYYLQSTLIKLRLSPHKLTEINAILQEGRKDYSQNFVERFKSWVKDFNDFK